MKLLLIFAALATIIGTAVAVLQYMKIEPNVLARVPEQFKDQAQQSVETTNAVVDKAKRPAAMSAKKDIMAGPGSQVGDPEKLEVSRAELSAGVPPNREHSEGGSEGVFKWSSESKHDASSLTGRPIQLSSTQPVYIEGLGLSLSVRFQAVEGVESMRLTTVASSGQSIGKAFMGAGSMMEIRDEDILIRISVLSIDWKLKAAQVVITPLGETRR